MQVEVRDFYPNIEGKNPSIVGTIRVAITDWGVEVLGILVLQLKNGWRFVLPGRSGVDHKTGKTIRYPLISMSDKEQHKKFIGAIKEQAIPFVESRLQAQLERGAIQSLPDAKKSNSANLKQSEKVGKSGCARSSSKFQKVK